MSANVYRLGTRDLSLAPADRIKSTVEAMRESAFAFLWVTGEVSRDAMADMLLSKVWCVLAESAHGGTNDMSTHIALYCGLTQYIGRASSESQALFLAPYLVAHACGVPLRVLAPELEPLLRLSESPIEERLAVHLANHNGHTLTAQHEVSTPNGKFRADFLVENDDRSARILVEADGHDFHERTKEQASRDKGRDRALVGAGYKVLRFTGSEIWRDPESCVSEVRAVLRGAG